jgi:uncharacterized Rossmann fold enzyme
MSEKQEVKRAFYDFAVSPYSFDFAQFLIAARAKGCTETVIVPGKRMVADGNGGVVEFQKCTEAQQEYRLNNLLLGLCPDAIVCQSRDEALSLWHEDCFPDGYTLEKPVQAHTLGAVMSAGKIHPFMPTKEMTAEVEKDGWKREKLAVITIRESGIKSRRNSNISEWIGAANWLAKRGWTPVFVPDTDNPDRVFGAHLSCKRAALDVQYRIALYDAAALNLGVNNGPMALNLYSRRPMLYFRPITLDYPESTIEFWRKSGIPYQSQPPWFSGNQRIIWEGTDDFATITDAVQRWERFMGGDKGAWPLSVAPIFPVKGASSDKTRGDQMKAALEAGKKYGWKQMVRKPHGEQVLSIACYGPSLADTWQDLKHPIMSVSGAHDFLVERGVIPDFHVDCDPRDHKAALLNKPQKETLYCMATCVHQSMWERLAEHKVELWHLHNGPTTDDWLSANDPGANRLGGGTTAGARAMEVGSMLGFKRFQIHGMDCSFRGDMRHAGKHGGKPQNAVECNVNGKWFVSSPQMIEAAREIITFISNYDVEIFFHGEGLQQHMIHSFKSRFGVIEPQQERKAA